MTQKNLFEILIGIAFLFVLYNGIALYLRLMGKRARTVSKKYEDMVSAFLLRKDVDAETRRRVIYVYLGTAAIAVLNFLQASLRAHP